MKNLFEIPELLTLDGTVFADGGPAGDKDPPNTCAAGCDIGCAPGACSPGWVRHEMPGQP